ncbi:MAG: hypothetical protein AAF411_31665, partial [Myxococcota bacterium]
MSAAEATIRRATLEVEVDGVTELVALALRDDTWIATSSDGRTDGPHVRAALQALGIAVEAGEEGERISRVPEAPRPQTWLQQLAPLLEELVTAIVRGGVRDHRESPSVSEALGAIEAILPKAVPLGIARALGRLREALSQRDVEKAARLLDGVTRLSQELSSNGETITPRIAAWLASHDGTVAELGRASRVSLSDRQLLEVGRGRLVGRERRGIERRHLLCMRSGTVYREDFDASGEGRTAGPSPRLLRVGLAESFGGPAPKRLRLLQYEVVPRVDETTLKRAGEFARRDFAALIDLYRKSKRSFPALAEPFVLVAAERYVDGSA